MDKLNKYRRLITKILEKQVSYKSSTGQIDAYAVCDLKTDNYILFNVGWHNSGRRQFGYPIHIRIVGGKISIEWDGTDQEIFQQLIDAGVAEEDIVFGFQRPEELIYNDLRAA